MGLDCSDSPLGRIPSMEIWWHKLVRDAPFLLHGRLVLFATLHPMGHSVFGRNRGLSEMPVEKVDGVGD